MKMKRPEDEAWDKVMQHVKVARAARGLAAAEKDLEGCTPINASKEWVDAIMSRAAASARITSSRPCRRRLLMQISAAALLLLALGATAGRLIWSERRDSDITMPYGRQVALMLASDAAPDPEESRRTALGWIADRACSGIRALQAIRERPDTEIALAAVADQELQRIRDLLGGMTTRSTFPTQDHQSQQMKTLADPLEAESRRIASLHSLAETTLDNIGLIVRMTTSSPRLSSDRDIAVRHLRKVLQ